MPSSLKSLGSWILSTLVQQSTWFTAVVAIVLTGLGAGLSWWYDLPLPLKICVTFLSAASGTWLFRTGLDIYQTWLRTRAPFIHVSYDGGPNGNPRLTVENRGCDGEFRASAEIVAVFEPAANRPQHLVYSLPWIESSGTVYRIPRGGRGTLSLGESETTHNISNLGGSLGEMRLLEATAGGPRPVGRYRWILLKDLPPLVVLKVTLVSEPQAASAFEQVFTIEGWDYGGMVLTEGNALLIPALRQSLGPARLRTSTK